MKFIILHGSFGKPTENWIPYLKEELEKLEQNVITPALPCEDWEQLTAAGLKYQPKKQNLNSWLMVFEKSVLPLITKDEPLCVIGHSLAPVFILHIIERFNLSLDSALFVSPFFEDIKGDAWQFYRVNHSFYKSDFDWSNLKKRIPVSYSIFSDNDPYVAQKYFQHFYKNLESSPIFIHNGGHLNSSSGYQKFPLLLDLCKARIGVN